MRTMDVSVTFTTMHNAGCVGASKQSIDAWPMHGLYPPCIGCVGASKQSIEKAVLVHKHITAVLHSCIPACRTVRGMWYGVCGTLHEWLVHVHPGRRQCVPCAGGYC